MNNYLSTEICKYLGENLVIRLKTTKAPGLQNYELSARTLKLNNEFIFPKPVQLNSANYPFVDTGLLSKGEIL